jgi:hypothetical protein
MLDAHLADGIFLREGENLNCAKSLKIPYWNLETNNFQDRRTEFETKLDMDQQETV